MSYNDAWTPLDHWADHPKYPPEDWIGEVMMGDTRQSYVEWVNSHLQAEGWANENTD